MTFDVLAMPWLPAAPEDLRSQLRALDEQSVADGAMLQRLASHRLDSASALALGRALRRFQATSALEALRPLRLAVLASSTFNFIVDALPAAALRRGLSLAIETAPYDQVAQQAFDPESFINTADADLTLVAVDHRWLGLNQPDVLRQGLGQAAIARLEHVCEALSRFTGRPLVIQTIATPPTSYFGSYDGQADLGLPSLIEEVNQWIRQRTETSRDLLLDVAALCAQIGSTRWFDPVAWNLYKIPSASSTVPLYCDWIARLLGAVAGTSRKCLVLDLDNTLWGGAIGDDGLAGIRLGNGSAEGEAFLSVQAYARALSSRGIILAVSSKNYEETARSAFQKHPDMLLQESDIAAFQANWTDKSANLTAIAKSLNIGLDALVLLDDNPVERAQVRERLPLVAVPELPADPAYFVSYLAGAGYFESITFSDEDLARTSSYVANAERVKVQASTPGAEDYLDGLKMEIAFEPFNEIGRKRIHQLVGKSNQFNLTTRRYAEAEIAAFEADSRKHTLQVRLRDRFGDFGMIGVVICDEIEGAQGRVWEIDTWLMSCRVLSRKVEQAITNYLVAAAAARNVTRLRGVYLPTAKNIIVARHYDDLGFTLEDETVEGTRIYHLDVDAFQAFHLPMTVK